MTALPYTQISSEAVNQLPGSGNVREKALGIRLGTKLENGHIVIKDIDSASIAADAGLVAGDLIVEVNGRPSNDFDVNALQSYLANKVRPEIRNLSCVCEKRQPKSSNFEGLNYIISRYLHEAFLV